MMDLRSLLTDVLKVCPQNRWFLFNKIVFFFSTRCASVFFWSQWKGCLGGWWTFGHVMMDFLWWKTFWAALMKMKYLIIGENDQSFDGVILVYGMIVIFVRWGFMYFEIWWTIRRNTSNVYLFFFFYWDALHHVGTFEGFYQAL